VAKGFACAATCATLSPHFRQLERAVSQGFRRFRRFRESARAVPSLAAAIAECLSLHAQALDRLGTDRPELDDRVDPEFRVKVVRQRSNVSASLEGDPELHRRHVEALNKGLSILLRRLAPQPPKPPRPSLPLWDDIAKAWRVPGPRQVDTGNPDRPFNDHIDDIF
jgi:hypothetical protein